MDFEKHFEEVDDPDEYVIDVLNALNALPITDPTGTRVVLAVNLLVANLALGYTKPTEASKFYLEQARHMILNATRGAVA